MFNRIAYCLVLPLLCGCTLLSNNEAIPHFSYDVPPGREDAQKDVPLDFPVVETDRDLDMGAFSLLGRSHATLCNVV